MVRRRRLRIAGKVKVAKLRDGRLAFWRPGDRWVRYIDEARKK